MITINSVVTRPDGSVVLLFTQDGIPNGLEYSSLASLQTAASNPASQQECLLGCAYQQWRSLDPALQNVSLLQGIKLSAGTSTNGVSSTGVVI